MLYYTSDQLGNEFCKSFPCFTSTTAQERRSRKQAVCITEVHQRCWLAKMGKAQQSGETSSHSNRTLSAWTGCPKTAWSLDATSMRQQSGGVPCRIKCQAATSGDSAMRSCIQAAQPPNQPLGFLPTGATMQLLNRVLQARLGQLP